MRPPVAVAATLLTVLTACAGGEAPVETSPPDTLPTSESAAVETAVPLDPADTVPPDLTLDGPFGPTAIPATLYCSSGVAGATQAEPVCGGALPAAAVERPLFEVHEGDPVRLVFPWAPAVVTVRVATLDDAAALDESIVELPDGTWTPAVVTGRYSLLLFVEWGPSTADYAALLAILPAAAGESTTST